MLCAIRPVSYLLLLLAFAVGCWLCALLRCRRGCRTPMPAVCRERVWCNAIPAALTHTYTHLSCFISHTHACKPLVHTPLPSCSSSSLAYHFLTSPLLLFLLFLHSCTQSCASFALLPQPASSLKPQLPISEPNATLQTLVSAITLLFYFTFSYTYPAHSVHLLKKDAAAKARVVQKAGITHTRTHTCTKVSFLPPLPARPPSGNRTLPS